MRDTDFRNLNKRYLYLNSIKAVAKLGAIVVAIDADLLLSYGGGIWDGTFGKSKCDASNINHAVTVVGYSSTNYWIIKYELSFFFVCVLFMVN